MKLSIIIPVYRVEQTLDRCVESVLAQTFTDFEAILVDDGSPDRCPQMCDEWAKRDQRLRVIHKPNGGLSDARNAGLEVANGNVVSFVDSDDYLAPNTYQHAMAALDDATDIVEFPVCRFEGSKRQAMLSFSIEAFDDMQDYWLRGHAYEHTYAWNKVYRRGLFDGVRFPVGHVFEDVATLPLLLQKARRVKTISQGLYHYCDNPDGITSTAQGKQLTDLLNAHLRVLPRWQDDRYYMHVVNIQMDVCRLTNSKPVIPSRRISPFAHGLTPHQRLKALILSTLGLPALCWLKRHITF